MEITATGLPCRSNQVLYYCPPNPTQNVIYFQGDTQDLRRHMETQYEEISRWKNWSLNDTCSILQTKFPGSAIWIVRPCTMLRNLFSCFHNFVLSSIVGAPEFNTSHGAIPHLYLLLKDSIHHACRQTSVELIEKDIISLPVLLIGFSKGCVVLNQILHELGNYISVTPPAFKEGTEMDKETSLSKGKDNDIKSFLNQIKSIYWLDSGHPGEEEAWIKDRDILSILSHLNPEVYVHVSPHQICCPSRPWIGEEEKEFISILLQLGVSVTEKIHFDNEPRSLLNHFRILNEF